MAAIAEGRQVSVSCTEPSLDEFTCNGRILENGNQGRLLVVWTVPVEMTAVSLENISCHAAQTIPHSKGPLIGTDLFDPMIPQSVTL
ncbi:hypothetical protein [Bacillus sp. P14.5]|uniref:hypothetical protein n=1 Tax=Bacillus sp. P14.5 TaxID=1983400 RepID=UPI0013B05E5F|nr:hypothetical protein [Bacillus sp. P14.5]